MLVYGHGGVRERERERDDIHTRYYNRREIVKKRHGEREKRHTEKEKRQREREKRPILSEIKETRRERRNT